MKLSSVALPRAAAWAALMTCAAAVRLFGLGAWPAGLWHDEALNGLNVRGILGGERPIFFYPDGYPQEPLFFYLQAVVQRLADTSLPEVWPLRLTGALVGLLTLPAFFAFARQLMPWRWAFFATALLAFHPWHVHFSRLGFRTILAPLIVSLLGWRLLAWTRRGGTRRAAEAGALLGASLYTYTAANLLVLATALFLALAWRTDPGREGRGSSPRRYLTGVAAGVAAALLVFAPLAYHYATDGARAASRAMAVGPGSEGYSLGRNLLGIASFFFVQGDPIFKHGPQGRPLFPFVLGAFFLGGLASACVGWKRRGGGWLFVLLTMAAFLGASALSFQAPNKLRSLGAAPAMILLFVQGVRLACDAARKLGAQRWLVRSAAGAGLALWAFAEASAFAYGWSASPAAYFEFNQAHTEIARWARGEPIPTAPRPRDPAIAFYVPADIAWHPTIRYMAGGLPVEVIRPLKSLGDAINEGRRRDTRAIYLLATFFRPRNWAILAELGLPAREAGSIGPLGGEPFGRILRIDLSELPAEGLSESRKALAEEYFAGY